MSSFSPLSLQIEEWPENLVPKQEIGKFELDQVRPRKLGLFNFTRNRR